MESLTKMFSGATSAVTGAVGANSNKKNNTKVTGLGPNIAPGNTHVNNPGATGGMGTQSQRGGRNKNKNKNKSKKNKNKNKNKKNKTRKNRSC